MRIAGSSGYYGRSADEKKATLPSSLHVEEIIISRSAFIRDRRAAMSTFLEELAEVWFRASLLSKYELETTLGIKLGSRKKQKLDLGLVVAEATTHDLILLVWHVTLVVSWFGGIACFDSLAVT